MARVAVALLMITTLLVACSSDPDQAALELPSNFPTDFPLPPDVEQLSEGAALILRAADTTVEELETFYRDELPDSGWEIVDEWEGVDPSNQPTSGLVVEEDEGGSGAIAFTAEGDTVVVRINLEQPTAVSPLPPSPTS